MKRLVLLALLAAAPAAAQTANTATNVRQAYGARLAAPAAKAQVKPMDRLDTRLANRINGRLSTRIERYRYQDEDPTATLARGADTGARAVTRTIAPVPQEDFEPR